jgi:hypothetical protein
MPLFFVCDLAVEHDRQGLLGRVLGVVDRDPARVQGQHLRVVLRHLQQPARLELRHREDDLVDVIRADFRQVFVDFRGRAHGVDQAVRHVDQHFLGVRSGRRARRDAQRGQRRRDQRQRHP